MVDVLIPDVLRPIPSALTQAIRNFAKNLVNWLTSAMTGCPEKIVQIKITVVSAFSQTLRRYTSLNHLAQAARAVLQNSSQIAQMKYDLNRVDFHNVQVGFPLNLWLITNIVISCQSINLFDLYSRNKPHGSANVTHKPFNVWKMNSNWHWNDKIHWKNGPPGYNKPSIMHWNVIRGNRHFRRPPDSSCSNGVFILPWLYAI